LHGKHSNDEDDDATYVKYELKCSKANGPYDVAGHKHGEDDEDDADDDDDV